ncbi:MAG: LacI family DNA-binding transcriptional regulator [Acidobacteriota bacterium]
MSQDNTPSTKDRGKAPRVRLKDVAALAEVSVSTVSLVLNGAPRAEALAAETRQRVLDAARELGYRPNYLARSLRGKRTHSLGVLVPEISEGYTAGVMSGIESELEAAGYTYLMVSHHSRPAKLESSIRLFEDRGVEGLLIIGAELPGPIPLPAVTVSGHRPVPGVTTVALDHHTAARLALGHLASLGHRRLAVIRGFGGNVDAEDRWRAIRGAAQDLDLELPPALTVELRSRAYGESFDAEGGYREGYEIGRRLLDAGEPFSALFAFNDISAIGALRAFLDGGLRAPEDISVVGFDDLGVTPFLNPRLTTIRQPLRDMGQAAARLLLAHLDDQKPLGERILIQPKLVVRDSTGPAPDSPSPLDRPGA